MASKSPATFLVKIILFALILSALIYALYWLWQRQPRQVKVENQNTTSQIQESTVSKDQSPFDPKENAIIKDKKIKFKGRTTPNSFVAIFSNSNQYISKSASDSTFEKEIAVDLGLNQIGIVTFNTDLKQTDKKSINYYLTSDKENIGDSDVFFAGPVNTTFDNLLTLNTIQGEKKVRTTKLTQVVSPKEDTQEKSSTSSALANIRIGDFTIAIGKVDKEDILTAAKLEIIRTDKPQNTEKLSLSKIVGSPKLNALAAKENEKLLDLTLNNNSDIQTGNKDGKQSDISKDKRAAIFWHDEKDKKIVDLIFLLP